MAQPPLSQQVKKLEQELRCQLFERSPKGLKLTAAGLALRQEASSLLGQAGRLGPRVRAAGGGEVGYLTVGCVPVACASIAPLLVRRFHQLYPGVHAVIRELDTLALYNNLSIGNVDVGIIRTGVDAPYLETMELLDEVPLLAMPDDHPLTSRETLSLSDLRNESFVLFARKLGMRHFDEFVNACHEVGGFSPRIASECESVNTQLAMVGAGLGIGFVTELSGTLKTPGVVYRRVPDLDVRIPLIVAWPTQYENPVRSRFLEVVASWRDDYAKASDARRPSMPN
jgi:DNA-binding transcriptional LysR family regulator